MNVNAPLPPLPSPSQEHARMTTKAVVAEQYLEEEEESDPIGPTTSEPPPYEDVILRIEDERQNSYYDVRCSRDRLRETSRYFHVLLDPEKFNEGIGSADKIEELRSQYGDISEAPDGALPVVTILDLPFLSVESKVIRQLLAILFEMLKGYQKPWPFAKKDTMERLAQLALLAERFEAQKTVKVYIYSRMQHVNTRSAPKSRGEVLLRQQLLISMILGYRDTVRSCSASLIVGGSKFWLQDYDGMTMTEEQPPWNMLPLGVEGENKT